MGDVWKAGEMVFVAKGDMASWVLAPVERVTPTGKPVVSGEMYDKNGVQRGSVPMWGSRARLRIADPDLIGKVDAAKAWATATYRAQVAVDDLLSLLIHSKGGALTVHHLDEVTQAIRTAIRAAATGSAGE